MYQVYLGYSKVVNRGKFIALNAYIKKEEIEISNVTSNLKNQIKRKK